MTCRGVFPRKSGWGELRNRRRSSSVGATRWSMRAISIRVRAVAHELFTRMLRAYKTIDAESKRPVNDTMPWWILPETMLALMLSYERTRDRENLEMYRDAHNAIYKGDYRTALREKKPGLFLKHIPDDFKSVSVEGNEFDATALRRFFPQRFANQVRLLEHNVTIEDIDILRDGSISAIVTLFTLEEFKRAKGGGTYFVTTIGTYRDVWQNRSGTWYEVRGDQLRNQTIMALRP
jgi:hypothetical protein